MILLLIVTLVTLVSSCTPIWYPAPLDIKNAGISAGLTEEQIQKAIILSGLNRGWIFRVLKEGALEGQINSRGLEAVVLVEYNTNQYSIQYLSSENLKFRDGRIHNRYNKWIRNLKKDIDIGLIRARY